MIHDVKEQVNGVARHEDIGDATAQVCFPNLDDGLWSLAKA